MLHRALLAAAAAQAATPPTFHDWISSNHGHASANPQTIATAGLDWAAGRLLLGCHATNAATTVLNSVAGDVDDTWSIDVNAAVGTSRLYGVTGTVVGAGLDANVDFSRSTSRRASTFLFVIAGSAGLDTHASNEVVNSGSGPTLPSCSAFTTDNPNCLIIAVANAIGSHVTNPPVAPSGYTLVGIESGPVDDPTDTTDAPTCAIAWRVQAAAGAVAAATWGGWGDIGTQDWSTYHFACRPA